VLTIQSSWWWQKRVEWFPEVIQFEVYRLNYFSWSSPRSTPIILGRRRGHAWQTCESGFSSCAARRGALASVSNYANSRGASAAYLRGWIGPVPRWCQRPSEHVHKIRSRNVDRASISFLILDTVSSVLKVRCGFVIANMLIFFTRLRGANININVCKSISCQNFFFNFYYNLHDCDLRSLPTIVIEVYIVLNIIIRISKNIIIRLILLICT